MRKYREDSCMFYLLRLYHNPKQIQESKDVAEHGLRKVANSGKVCDSGYFVMLEPRSTLSIVIRNVPALHLLPSSKNNVSKAPKHKQRELRTEQIHARCVEPSFFHELTMSVQLSVLCE
jgi:hypothetical protein